MNTYEEQIERDATRDDSPLFIEYIISFHDGVEDDELVYSEEDKEFAKEVFKDACKVAKFDNDTVLTEIKMFERWTYPNETIERNEITNT